MTQTIQCHEKGNQVSYHFNMCDHSLERSAQRGFNEQTLLDALDYSEPFPKQGLVFCVVKNNELPHDMPAKKKGKLKNLVIVVSPWEAKIITCYRSKNGMKSIKRKSKRNALKKCA